MYIFIYLNWSKYNFRIAGCLCGISEPKQLRTFLEPWQCHKQNLALCASICRYLKLLYEILYLIFNIDIIILLHVWRCNKVSGSDHWGESLTWGALNVGQDYFSSSHTKNVFAGCKIYRVSGLFPLPSVKQCSMAEISLYYELPIHQ